MIKFVLGLIALVFVGLAIYVYTDKENKPPREHTVHKTVKQETPSEREVSVTEPKAVVKTEEVVKHVVKKENVKVEKSSVKNIQEDISTNLSDETIYVDDSMSEEERKIDKAIRSQSENIEFEVSSEEEILETIKKDYGQSN